MKSFFILSVVLCSFFQQNENIIVWNKDRKLKYSDFEGILHDSTSIYLAATSCDIRKEYFLDSNVIKYNVFSFFKKNTSFMIELDSNLLMHEQFHFNISELHARFIRRYLNEVKTYDVDTIKLQINNIIKHKRTFDSLYDKETLHGAYYTMQKKWNVNIEKMLDSLKEYENPEGTIILN